MNSPFDILQADLKWLERALAAVIDDYGACAAPEGWDKYYARAGMVQAAERSIRRQHGIRYCVFGNLNTCHDKLVPNCEACQPDTRTE